jgi:hypothetical protein
MCRLTTLALTTTALLCLAVALPAGNAVAQQKQRVSYKVSAENSKFTQQLNIDAGDLPNHIMRVYEVHRTFPNDAPVINGLKLVEEWDRGTADLADGNGTGTLVSVYVMENGDKFFDRRAALAQGTPEKSTSTHVGYITGGTGKFAGMQGSYEHPPTTILKRASPRPRSTSSTGSPNELTQSRNFECFAISGVRHLSMHRGLSTLFRGR